MAIHMGYWDCPQCHAKHIQGIELVCTSCGAARDPKIAFYSDDDAEVTDAKALAIAKGGVNWACGFCGKDNHSGSQKCEQCGAERDTTKHRVAQMVTPAPAASPPAVSSRSGWAAWKIAVVVGVVALAGFGIWWHWFRTTAHKVRLDQIAWTKTQAIEKRQLERHEAWAGDVPAGARELSRTTRQRSESVADGTVRVKVGKRNLGNGTFEDVFEDKPKYVQRQVDRPWVSYEIERWVVRQQLSQATRDGSEPSLPHYAPLGDERLGASTNVATLSLSGGGQSWDYKIDLTKVSDPLATVRSYKVGEQLVAHVTGAGAVRSLDRQ